MKKEYADKWVAALRSGEFKQTTGGLKDEVGHCCLGVLCELVEPGSLVQNDEGHYGYADRGFEEEVLPGPIQKIVGMQSELGNILLELDGTRPNNTSLADLNDKARLDFKAIADIIEKHWEKL